MMAKLSQVKTRKQCKRRKEFKRQSNRCQRNQQKKTDRNGTLTGTRYGFWNCFFRASIFRAREGLYLRCLELKGRDRGEDIA